MPWNFNLLSLQSLWARNHTGDSRIFFFSLLYNVWGFTWKTWKLGTGFIYRPAHSNLWKLISVIYWGCCLGHSCAASLCGLGFLTTRNLDSKSKCPEKSESVSPLVMSDSLQPHGLSMGFSRKGYWSGLPFPSPGDLPDPVVEPGSPALQADSLPSEPPRRYALMSLPQRPCKTTSTLFYSLKQL